MNSTGIVRRIDDLGRIVLPVELRQMFGVRAGDDLEIWRQDEAVAIAEHRPVCVFCCAGEGLER